MLDSGLIDALILASPHYWHAPHAVAAAQRGIHVMAEKPMASDVGDARIMIQQCRKHKVALGVMFMMRTRPVMAAMKNMVDSGQLGKIYRISLIASNWFRSQAYYDSGAWRGTWDGEGGGVLINQAPHSLDLFQWIGGMPKSLSAILQTPMHKVEVETSAQIILDYGDGKTGYIYATTGESPGAEQLSVAGTRGTLVSENKLRFCRLETPLDEHLRTTTSWWDPPASRWEDVPVNGKPDDGKHIVILRNFADHLIDGTPLLTPGSECINELEISNAAYIAGYKHKTVELPVDAKEIEAVISKLIRERSTGQGGNVRAKAKRELHKLLKQ